MSVFDSVCDADDEWATDSDPEDIHSEEAGDTDVSEGDGDTDSMLHHSGSPETVTYDEDDNILMMC